MKTTRRDFEKFKAAFIKYQRLLNRQDYKILFRQIELNQQFASLHVDHEGRVASVSMNSELSADDYADFNPAASGKHEAIHLFLGPLYVLARDRYASEAEIACAEEGLVRVLEKLL